MDKFKVPSEKQENQKPRFPLGFASPDHFSPDAPTKSPFAEISEEPTEIPGTPSEVPGPRAPRTPEGDSNRLKSHFRDSSSALDFSTEFHRGSRSGGVGYKLVAWSFVAALIDALILFSLSCLFLLSFSFLVKSQLGSMLQVLGGSVYQVGFLGGGLILVTYMIMLRVFLGFTIGEWACSLRLGNLKQRLNRYYSLRVVARMFLIFLTGLVILPFFSLLTGRDLAGLLIRLPLIQVRGD